MLQSDTLAVAPYTVPATAPNGVHLSGSEEVVTNSMVSRKLVILVLPRKMLTNTP